MDTQHRCDDTLTGRKSAYYTSCANSTDLTTIRSPQCSAGCSHTEPCPRGANCIGDYRATLRDRARSRRANGGD
jgi:hypothetical protein